MTTLETERLILRQWKFSDSKDLFEYAKDPNVGPNAGWSPHEDEEESKNIIKMFIDNDEYAIVHKADNKVIGSIGLFNTQNLPESSQEIGYVLSPKYWGNGLIPEAVEKLKQYGFNEMKLEEIWCGHYDFNSQSKRVNEKCGFEYQHTQKDTLVNLDGREVNTLMYKISRTTYFIYLNKLTF